MRCRKAHWFLSARCDGTLSERHRQRLEEHLKGCAECRREAFYFSEIAVSASRLEKVSVRPDFNVRLRASIHRTETVAETPKPWFRFTPTATLRPALTFGVIVLALGGAVTGYVMTQSDDSSIGTPAAFSGGNETLPESPLALEPGMTPVSGQTAEDQRVIEQYKVIVQQPGEYLIETARLDDPMSEKRFREYLNPTIPADQMARQTSY